jgi:o-succinylbenzoate synthase
MQARIIYHPLKFRTPSGTSRGILHEKDSWFLVLEDQDILAVGECSLIPGLSLESRTTAGKALEEIVLRINQDNLPQIPELDSTPAVKMAYEMALLGLENAESPFKFFNNSFLDGKAIPINGLVWMGSKQFMFDQIKNKINEGFRCIKIKVAAIDFEEELSLIKYIRSEFSSEDMMIRVDANGGFEFEDAYDKLSRLADLEVHSIEQPIKQGQWTNMAELCDKSSLPIALDEELIGLHTEKDRVEMLETIQPQFIILKPSLVGGFLSASEWIELAEKRNIGWWATSALESNIGLNAIAQWTCEYDTSAYQGLGTGSLFTNNIDSPLMIENARLIYTSAGWDLSLLKAN